MLQEWMNRLLTPKKIVRKTTQNRCVLNLESLEGRVVPAVALMATPVATLTTAAAISTLPDATVSPATPSIFTHHVLFTHEKAVVAEIDGIINAIKAEAAAIINALHPTTTATESSLGVAALSQANTAPQSILKLFQ